jgi:hypothetical protein
MARSNDDREEAPGWYARWRLEQEEKIGPERMTEVRKILGGGDPKHGKQILHQMRNARGAGIMGLIRLAEVLGERSPGRVLDEALSWWDRTGRGYAEHMRAKPAPARGPRKRTKSGTLRAVARGH